MKIIVSIIAIIVLIPGVVYSSDPLSELGYTEFTLVTVNGIEGAIIPTERLDLWDDVPGGIEDFLGIEETVSGFWTPGIEDIEKAETSLNKHLENYNVGGIAEILNHFDEFKRQYFGLIIDDKKVVYINSFPARCQTRYSIYFIVADDGYFWYWRVMYWIDDNKFTGLECNGIA